jgi:hypothetical protein
MICRAYHLLWKLVTRFQAVGYLVNTPANYLTQKSIEKFVSELKANEEVELTQAEVLQLLNLRPSTAVEVHAVGACRISHLHHSSRAEFPLNTSRLSTSVQSGSQTM